jgi:membrane protein implicated in regulation of membrane protease activity
VKRLLRDNGLTLFFGTLFLLALAVQAVAGFLEYNNQQVAAGGATISLLGYLTSSDFAVDTAENRQSEYLQFLLYILYIFATVWLVQRGSPESKQVDKAGSESDEEQLVGPHARLTPQVRITRAVHASGGTADHWGWSWARSSSGRGAPQSIAGRAAYNGQQLRHLEDPVTWAGYLSSADFWSRTPQNWQSEFLAIASMVVFSIFLRQRGSHQSKPVGAAHSATERETWCAPTAPTRSSAISPTRCAR